MSQEDGDMTRRTALKGVATAGTAAALGGGGLLAASGGATASIGMETNPVTVDTPDGQVSKVYINPHGTIEWENFDEDVEHLRVAVESRVLNYNDESIVHDWTTADTFEFGPLGEQGGLSGGFSGGESIVGPVTLYGDDTAHDASTFNADVDGEVQQRYVEVRITVKFLNSDMELADPDEKAEVTETGRFRAKNQNLPGESSVSASLEGGMEAENGTETEE